MAKISLYKNFRRLDILRKFINAKIFTTKVFVHENFQIYGIYIYIYTDSEIIVLTRWGSLRLAPIMRLFILRICASRRGNRISVPFHESRAAKNSDFVRVIGFFNPPLRVRTDIYAINDLFGLWTRYKIGINLNYSDTSHFAHAHGTS